MLSLTPCSKTPSVWSGIMWRDKKTVKEIKKEKERKDINIQREKNQEKPKERYSNR
jgi:hypothetical protein